MDHKKKKPTKLVKLKKQKTNHLTAKTKPNTQTSVSTESDTQHENVKEHNPDVDNTQMYILTTTTSEPKA